MKHKRHEIAAELNTFQSLTQKQQRNVEHWKLIAENLTLNINNL